jgi:hypothetical protein
MGSKLWVILANPSDDQRLREFVAQRRTADKRGIKTRKNAEE